MNRFRALPRPLLLSSVLLSCAGLFACGGGGADVASSTAQALPAVPAVPVAAAAPLPPVATAAGGLHGRLIVGYQGWFGCPGDFEDNPGWSHWFQGAPALTSMTFDALPAVRGLAAADLCDTGIARPTGGTVQLFSSQRPGVVQAHFSWMQEHGIDGAAVQRFVVQLDGAAQQRRTENMLANVRAAAETHGRVFYLSYDVSGADPATVVAAIRRDWRRFSVDLKMTDSAAYLKDGGKPVLQLWGFGVADRPGEPAEVAALIADLKSGDAGLTAATLIGGVPADWRSLGGDSKTAPAWAAVYRAYDVVSPWAVGRYVDDASADDFIRSTVLPDLAETRRLGLRYLPVVFPGFSWHNLMGQLGGQPAQASLNLIPRHCGRFLWRQVWNLLDAGNDMVYAAMFDETDEGTALFRVEPAAASRPPGAQLLTLDQDGCTLPDDWYLRVTGQAAAFLRSGTLPPRALADVIRP